MLDPLERAVAAFRQSKGSLDEVAACYYASPRVRRVIAHACFSFGAPSDFREDLRQELGLLLTERFVHVIEDPEKTYNVLHRTAVNIARRKVAHSSESSLEAMMERSDELEPSTAPMMRDPSDTLVDVLAARLDRDSAMREFSRRAQAQEGAAMSKQNREDDSLFYGPRKIARHRPLTRAKDLAIVKIPNKYKPGPDGLELTEIRTFLGYTVPKFAEVLGVSKGALGSYLYGVVQDVPPQVMAEARALRRQSSGVRHRLAVRWGGVSMESQVALWGKRLGIDSESATADTELATVLQVDRATVWRWRSREMRPSPERIDELDRLVTATAKAAKVKASASEQEKPEAS